MTVEQVRELLESGKTDGEIGAIFGRDRRTVQSFRARYGLAASGPVGRTRRFVDRDLTAPKLDGTTRVYPIRPGKPSLRVDLAALRDSLAAEVREITAAWKPAKPPVPVKGATLLHVVAPVDLHVGKLAWAPETGEDFDSAIATQRLHGAVDRLLSLAHPFGVKEQLLVVGNDLLQVDNLLQSTTAGTLQDTDGRYRKMFRLSVCLMADTIRRMLAVAPVRVLVVPGNHDVLATFHVGEVLSAMFRDVDAVTIDDCLRPRIYYRHGLNLLGFTHGHEEAHHNLPLIMAQERPDDWAATRYREFLIGHYHHRKQTSYTAGDTFNGVRVSILPTLTGTDAWHSRKGYIGEPKASESRLYCADAGPIAAFTATMAV
jgi:hypothetical protein